MSKKKSESQLAEYDPQQLRVMSKNEKLEEVLKSLTPEQTQFLKSISAPKGCTDAEWKGFLSWCIEEHLNPFNEEAYLLPFGGKQEKKQPYAGYHGLLKKVKSETDYYKIVSGVVNEGDDAEIDVANSQVLKHVVKASKPGQPILGYCMIVRKRGNDLVAEGTILFWDEYRNMAGNNYMLGKMPRRLLEKEAIRLACKKVYNYGYHLPETFGYDSENLNESIRVATIDADKELKEPKKESKPAPQPKSTPAPKKKETKPQPQEVQSQEQPSDKLTFGEMEASDNDVLRKQGANYRVEAYNICTALLEKIGQWDTKNPQTQQPWKVIPVLRALTGCESTRELTEDNLEILKAHSQLIHANSAKIYVDGETEVTVQGKSYIVPDIKFTTEVEQSEQMEV